MASAIAAKTSQLPAGVNQAPKSNSIKKSVFLGVKGSSSLPTYTSSNGALILCEAKKSVDKWAGLGTDISDDQQDIARGKGLVDSLFQGAFGVGTQNAVMSSYDYISQGQRTFEWDNMKDGYYIAPAFMDKIVVHLSKNFMNLPNIKVPLILGVWGGKGQGKSFQTELIMAKLGINPIVMSAGELESGNAGEPAKLIRQRYREAADIIKKGKMCCMFINDLDAGAGRMGGTTQYTVNNQMVNATLMNIADNPTNVQLPGIYNKEEIPRVPIIVTGNDFSTLYAPLIRDGRMEKFYWAPTREDRVGVAKGIFRLDGITEDEVTTLVDTFPGQSIDFFGALRARVYDDEVRKWVAEVGIENIGKKLVNSRDGPPTFDQPIMSLDVLLKYGWMLVREQDNVKRVQLADEYLSGAALGNANDDADGIRGKAAQQLPPPVKQGCADPNAVNYDPTARSDDGSCVYDFSEPAKAVTPSNGAVIPRGRGGVRGRGRGVGRSVSPARGAPPPPSPVPSYEAPSQSSFSASALDSLIEKTPSLDSIVPVVPSGVPRGGPRGRGRGSARSRSPARAPAPIPSSPSDSFFPSESSNFSYSEPVKTSFDDIKPIIPSSLPARRGRGGARSRSPPRAAPISSPPSQIEPFSFETPTTNLDDIKPVIPASPVARAGGPRGRGRGGPRSRSPPRSSSPPAVDTFYPASETFDSPAPASLADIQPIIPVSGPARGRGRGRGARSRSPPRSSSPAPATYESYSAPVETSFDNIVPVIPSSTPTRGRGRGARSRSPPRGSSPPPAAYESYSAPVEAALDDIVPVIPSSLPTRGRGRGRGARSRSPARSLSPRPASYESYSAPVEASFDNIVPVIPSSLPTRGRGRGRGARSRSPPRGSSPPPSTYESYSAPVEASFDNIVPVIPSSLPTRGRGRGRGARSRSPARSLSPRPASYESYSKPAESFVIDEIVPVIPSSTPVRGGLRGRGRGGPRSRSPPRAVAPPPPVSSDSWSTPAESFSSSYEDIKPVIPSSTPVRGGRGRGRGGPRSRSPSRAVAPPTNGGYSSDSFFPSESSYTPPVEPTFDLIQPVVPAAPVRGRALRGGRGRGGPRSRSPSRSPSPPRDTMTNGNAFNSTDSFWSSDSSSSYSSPEPEPSYSYDPSPATPIIPKDSNLRGRGRSRSRGGRR